MKKTTTGVLGIIQYKYGCEDLSPMLPATLAVVAFHTPAWRPSWRPRHDRVALSELEAGVEGIAGRYDAFLLDQFGVLHDGSKALPGAVACFEELARRGKRLVVLSNTSRRQSDAMRKISELGFRTDALSGFICSGEQAWQHMARQCSGQRVFWLGWDDDYLGFDNAGYMDGLDVSLTTSPEDCDVVLAQGTQLVRSSDGSGTIQTSVFTSGEVDGRLADCLGICQRRGVPMLCANPDFRATQPDKSVGYMPGIVARHFELSGGTVVHFGKPFVPAFDACVELLDGLRRDRICHVGDSLHHDILGANDARIDSLFITAGIHAAELPPQSDPGYLPEVAALCERTGATPSYRMQHFVW